MELDEQIAWLEDQLRWALMVINNASFGDPISKEDSDDAARVSMQIDEVMNS